VMCDGPAGLRISPTRQNDKNTYFCTGFPIGSCLSSTWNTDLIKEVGTALGNEVLEYGSDVILGPGMNIHRNPLCGRNFEYFSEDPFLTGKIAASWICGAQSNGIGVSAKHFVMNNQETNRMGNNVITDQRTMREIYLKVGSNN
jgi:beta-glucosidase